MTALGVDGRDSQEYILHMDPHGTRTHTCHCSFFGLV